MNVARGLFYPASAWAWVSPLGSALSRAPAMAMALVVGAVLAASGCVPPGDIDRNLLNRYDSELVSRGPQQRQGTAGLEPLQPTANNRTNVKCEQTAVDRIIETTRHYEVMGEQGELKRVRLNTTIKTTHYQRQASGEVTERTDTRTEQTELDVKQVPPDDTSVEVVRVGVDSGNRTIADDSRSLVYLSLDEAVMRTLANSLDIQLISYDPAVSYEQMVQAAAVFDWTVFGSAQYQNQDSPSFFTPLLGSQTNRIVRGEAQTNTYQAGIRKHTITGADVAAAWTSTRTWSSSSRTAWQNALTLEVQQPLLRNAGPEFNLAQLRIAQINRKLTEQQFRQRVEETVNQAISLYWQLVQARRNVQIQQALLQSTEDTLRTVRERFRVDATIVEVKQSEAAVSQRLATLYQTQKAVFDVQDQLARLMADSQLNMLKNYEIVPVSQPCTVPVTIDEANQLLLALQYNPQLDQARAAIDIAEVNIRVARNQTLPEVNLQGQLSMTGLDRTWSKSVDNMFADDFFSYALAVQAQYPLGNRGPLSVLRQRRLEKMRNITQMQNVMDQVAVLIRERLRSVRTNYQQMLANRAAVEAARVQLQALNDTEKIRGRLTPEFLQVKLQAQQTLALNEAAEIQSVAEYNSALADLARATGTILRCYGLQVRAVADAGPWPAPREGLPLLETFGGPTTQPLETLPDAPGRVVPPADISSQPAQQ